MNGGFENYYYFFFSFPPFPTTRRVPYVILYIINGVQRCQIVRTTVHHPQACLRLQTGRRCKETAGDASAGCRMRGPARRLDSRSIICVRISLPSHPLNSNFLPFRQPQIRFPSIPSPFANHVHRNVSPLPPIIPPPRADNGYTVAYSRANPGVLHTKPTIFRNSNSTMNTYCEMNIIIIYNVFLFIITYTQFI